MTAARAALWSDALWRFLHHRGAVMSLGLMGLLMVAVILGPLASPFGAGDVAWDFIDRPPDWASGHWFGTDANGRDLLVRVLEGGQVSLRVGIVATLIAVVVGVGWGAVAGYAGGRVDAVMMRTVDILYALPFMLFVILLTVVFGQSLLLMFVAIGAVEWLDIARIARGQTLALKKRDFIDAARAIGVSPAGIVWRHIVPNLMGPVVVFATLTVPKVIVIESFLSFLGLGVREPDTSWGLLIAEGADAMETAPWRLGFPALFLALTVLCMNFIGDGLRDALDPKDR